jgi:hypothetical protein
MDILVKIYTSAAILELGCLTGEEFDQLMKPEKMTRP